MQDVQQLRQEWAARDRALRRRQARQTVGVVLATLVLALLPALVWLGAGFMAGTAAPVAGLLAVLG
jgi:type VI protein secretion system component VasF